MFFFWITSICHASDSYVYRSVYSFRKPKSKLANKRKYKKLNKKDTKENKTYKNGKNEIGLIIIMNFPEIYMDRVLWLISLTIKWNGLLIENWFSYEKVIGWRNKHKLHHVRKWNSLVLLSFNAVRFIIVVVIFLLDIFCCSFCWQNEWVGNRITYVSCLVLSFSPTYCIALHCRRLHKSTTAPL